MRPRARFLPIVVLLALVPAPASAQYVQRFGTTASGAITLTGNALGLDAETSQNGEGTRGAIGTFITTDTSQRDTTPAPTTAALFPIGTTNDWRLNRSMAVLQLPARARVLHAELVWGGTFAGNTPEDNVSAFLNDPVLFTTPSGTFAVVPDPATARIDGAIAGTGTCNGCFYVRTADVTALVAAAGRGSYAVGRVPATQGTTDNNNPVAGWTLAVAYEDFTQPVRSLTLFLGLEQSGGAAASVSGFCTALAGPVAGRLAVSAIEGDARTTGDQMWFGPTADLSTANRLSGPRNPETNFFSSQILNDTGELDTLGTFGSRNHTPGAPVDGARQGWDISNVNVSPQLLNNQTSAFARGTTTGDGYRVMVLALQIDVSSPAFASSGSLMADRTAAVIGDVITYTVRIDNSAGAIAATNVVFHDPPPVGMSFVANSFTLDGVVVPGADPSAGVPIGVIPAGGVVTVQLQMRVDTIPAGPLPHLRVNRAHWTYQFVSCAGQPVQSGGSATNDLIVVVPVADLSVTKVLVTSPVVAGAQVTYRIIARNDGPSSAPGAIVTDGIATPPLIGVTWTCLGQLGAQCGALSGTGPPSTTANLPPNGTAIYTVTGTLDAATPPGPFSSPATITAPAGVPDFNLTNNSVPGLANIVVTADIRLEKSGPASAQRGTDLTFTIVAANDGPSNATNVLVTDPTPPGLILQNVTGACWVAPGCAIAAGASETLTITFHVPPDYAGADPIVNIANVASGTTDPEPDNDSARATSALGAPVADLAIVKTDGIAVVTAGTPITYTIDIQNFGPASAIGARVTDVLNATIFTGVSWTCTAAGTSSCGSSSSGTGDINATIDVAPGLGNIVTFAVTATVRADATGSVTNTAIVRPADGTTDAIAINNTATDVNMIFSEADMSIVKAGPTTIVPGTVVEYTITVASTGPSAARNFDFVEVPQPGVDLFSFPFDPTLIQQIQGPPDTTCENGSFRVIGTGQEFTAPYCKIPLLLPGDSRVFTVRLLVPAGYVSTLPAGAPQAILNAALFLRAEVDNDPDLDDLNAFARATLSSQADVAIAMAGPRAAIGGSTISYFLRVMNNGASTATGVVIDNPIPPGIVLAAIDGPCTTFPCAIPILQPGQAIDIRVDLEIPLAFAAPTAFTTTATVSSTTPDVVTGNNQSAVTTSVGPAQADLTIIKTGPASVAPGGLLRYDLIVRNTGLSRVDPTWTDALPGGTTFVSIESPDSFTCTTPTAGAHGLVHCTSTSLEPGAEVAFAVVARANATLLPGSTLANVAVVHSSAADLNTSDNRSQVDTRVAAPGEADVSVTMAATLDVVSAGDNVTYTLTVRNTGPAAATGVSVTDTLPASFALMSATTSQGTCSGTTCAIGTMAPGATATITIVAGAAIAGVFTNAAAVSAVEVDPAATNNSATRPTVVAAPGEADLVIEKTGATILRPGRSGIYTLRITNRGPAPAVGVHMDNNVPAPLILFGSLGACGEVTSCDFGTIAPGETRTIVTALSVPNDAVTPATVVIVPSVFSQTPDPNPANNVSPVTATILAPDAADLVVVIADSPDPVLAAATFTYTITVVNRGPAAVSDANVSHTRPAGVSPVSVVTSQGACTIGPAVSCAIGAMGIGATATIAVTVRAPDVQPSPNPVSSTATVASSAPDPDVSTNVATQLTTIVAPDLANLGLTKFGPTRATPGSAVGYAIQVTNLGPGPAQSVTVIDTASAGLVFVSNAGACTTPFPCALGNLAVGEVRTITATFLVADPFPGTGPVVNTATVTSLTVDPDLTNNTASVTSVVPLVDLRIAKSGPASAAIGQTVSYTIVVSNDGPNAATGVRISDPTPTGLSFVSASGACASGFPCVIGALPPGAAATVTATYRVSRTLATLNITNTASVTSEMVDLRPADNAATFVTTIRRTGPRCDINGDGRDEIVVGVGRRDGGPHVRVFSIDPAGSAIELLSFYAYFPAFPGGVFVACGDVTGDGTPEIVTGADVGGGPHVQVWQIGTGGATSVASFYAFEPGFDGGVRVAVADIDGNGVDEILTGAGAGGLARLSVFSLINGSVTQVLSVGAYDPSFNGGVFVASCDVTGDGRSEIIAGVGRRDGGPHVKVLSVNGGAVSEIASFNAYFPLFAGGTFVACGDANGDGVAEIMTGADVGGGPHVLVFSLSGGIATPIVSAYAFEPEFEGGVRVAMGDVNGDGIAEIITGAGAGGSPRVRVFSVASGMLVEIASFFAYDPAFTGGIFVASGGG